MKIRSTLHNLAQEAKAEETKIVGRHRDNNRRPMSHRIHRTAVHLMHTGQLTAIGLPAILAFEAARPVWEKFVEAPMKEFMFGHDSSAHVEALSTISTHFLG